MKDLSEVISEETKTKLKQEVTAYKNRLDELHPVSTDADKREKLEESCQMFLDDKIGFNEFHGNLVKYGELADEELELSLKFNYIFDEDKNVIAEKEKVYSVYREAKPPEWQTRIDFHRKKAVREWRSPVNELESGDSEYSQYENLLMHKIQKSPADAKEALSNILGKRLSEYQFWIEANKQSMRGSNGTLQLDKGGLDLMIKLDNQALRFADAYSKLHSSAALNIHNNSGTVNIGNTQAIKQDRSIVINSEKTSTELDERG